METKKMASQKKNWGVDIFKTFRCFAYFFKQCFISECHFTFYTYRLQIRWFIFYIFLWQFGTVSRLTLVVVLYLLDLPNYPLTVDVMSSW